METTARMRAKHQFCQQSIQVGVCLWAHTYLDPSSQIQDVTDEYAIQELQLVATWAMEPGLIAARLCETHLLLKQAVVLLCVILTMSWWVSGNWVRQEECSDKQQAHGMNTWYLSRSRTAAVACSKACRAGSNRSAACGPVYLITQSSLAVTGICRIPHTLSSRTCTTSIPEPMAGSSSKACASAGVG